MREIELTQGYKALVDDEDYERINLFKWRVSTHNRGKSQYGARTIRRADGKRTTLMLHRFILDYTGLLEVDHMNGNGLDNRRGNIRLVSHQENMKNYGEDRRNTSGQRGVCWDKRNMCWMARISRDGTFMNLGRFKLWSDAVGARKAAEQQFGYFQRESIQTV